MSTLRFSIDQKSIGIYSIEFRLFIYLPNKNRWITNKCLYLNVAASTFHGLTTRNENISFFYYWRLLWFTRCGEWFNYVCEYQLLRCGGCLALAVNIISICVPLALYMNCDGVNRDSCCVETVEALFLLCLLAQNSPRFRIQHTKVSVLVESTVRNTWLHVCLFVCLFVFSCRFYLHPAFVIIAYLSSSHRKLMSLTARLNQCCSIVHFNEATCIFVMLKCICSEKKRRIVIK